MYRLHARTSHGTYLVLWELEIAAAMSLCTTSSSNRIRDEFLTPQPLGELDDKITRVGRWGLFMLPSEVGLVVVSNIYEEQDVRW